MYINRISLKNIRSLESLQWQVKHGNEAGWHVILGDNGSGKSTILRCVALGLVGPQAGIALRQNWNDWLRRGESKGEIRLILSCDRKYDEFSGKTKIPVVNSLEAVIKLERKGNDVHLKPKEIKDGSIDPNSGIWGDRAGWFSSAYGPFRRFTGSDKEYEKIFDSNPKLAAHLSVFSENVALTESLQWLQELQFKKLEQKLEQNGKESILDKIRTFVNQPDFLPHQARLDSISSTGVEFLDGNGCKLPVESLSDGYRSILSMTFELIRQLARNYGEAKIFSEDCTKIIVPGVVLIDEIDAHLHPTWQRRVGKWFREHFPEIQFIVTTHSPLICQAATHGSVWRLPRPGSDEQGSMIKGKDLDRLLYGNILDAYSTEAFGADVTRSDESKIKLRRLAELNQKELFDALTSLEQSEQIELRAMMPTTAHKIDANGTPLR